MTKPSDKAAAAADTPGSQTGVPSCCTNQRPDGGSTGKPAQTICPPYFLPYAVTIRKNHFSLQHKWKAFEVINWPGALCKGNLVPKIEFYVRSVREQQCVKRYFSNREMLHFFNASNFVNIEPSRAIRCLATGCQRRITLVPQCAHLDTSSSLTGLKLKEEQYPWKEGS